MIDDDVDKYEALKELRYAVKKQDRENVVKILNGCIEKGIFSFKIFNKFYNCNTFNCLLMIYCLAESNPDVCNKAYEVLRCSWKKFKNLMKNPEKPVVPQQSHD